MSEPTEAQILLQRFFASAKRGDLDDFKEEMKSQKNINVTDELGNTAVHWAASAGHLDLVRYLVEQCKANVNPKNKIGESPLHKAVWRGHLDVVKYLVEKTDAQYINDVTTQGKKPVDLAHHLEVKAYLQSYEGTGDELDEEDLEDDDD